MDFFGLPKELLVAPFVGEHWLRTIPRERTRRAASGAVPDTCKFAGMNQFHALLRAHAPAFEARRGPEHAAAPLLLETETERGSWLSALPAKGNLMFVTNPLSFERYGRDTLLNTDGAGRDARCDYRQAL